MKSKKEFNMKIKFYNAQLVTVNNTFDVIENGQLVVNNNTIEYVGKNIEHDTQLYDKEINCKGNVLMPGLINTHSHAAMSLFRGMGDGVNFEKWWKKTMLPLEQSLTDADFYKGVKISASEMVANGITTFFDCYFNYKQTIKACNDVGIRVGIGFGAISGSNKFELNDLEKQYEYLKAQPNVIPFLYAHSTYSCDEYQFATLLTMARKHNLVFSTHVSETLSEVGECHNKYGVTPVGLLESYGMFDVPCVLAHCVHCDKDDVNILKKYNVTIAHNPASNLKLGSGIAPVYSFVKNGLNVSLGTDGAASNNGLDMLKEMYLAGTLQFGTLNNAELLQAQDLIKMATINGAKGFGVHNIGALIEGYLADIIMLDVSMPNMQPQNNLISNIAFSANTKNVVLTMVNGTIVYNTFM